MFKYKLSNAGREFFGLLLSFWITTFLFYVFPDTLFAYYLSNLLFDFVLIAMFWDALEANPRSLLRYIFIFSFAGLFIGFYLVIVIIFDFGPTLFERK